MYKQNPAIRIEGFSAGEKEKFRMPLVLFLPEDQADIVGLTYQHIADKVSLALLSKNEFCNLTAHLPVDDKRFPVKALMINEEGEIILKVQVKAGAHIDPDELILAIRFILNQREAEQKAAEKSTQQNAINNLRLAFLLSSAGIEKGRHYMVSADNNSLMD